MVSPCILQSDDFGCNTVMLVMVFYNDLYVGNRFTRRPEEKGSPFYVKCHLHINL